MDGLPFPLTEWHTAGRLALARLDATLAPQESVGLRLLAWALTREHAGPSWVTPAVLAAVSKVHRIPNSLPSNRCRLALSGTVSLQCPKVAVLLTCLLGRTLTASLLGVDCSVTSSMWTATKGSGGYLDSVVDAAVGSFLVCLPQMVPRKVPCVKWWWYRSQP